MFPKFLEQPPHGTKNLSQATSERDERINKILNDALAAGRIAHSDVERFRSLEAEFKRLSQSAPEVENSGSGEGVSRVELEKSRIYTLMKEILSK